MFFRSREKLAGVSFPLQNFVHLNLSKKESYFRHMVEISMKWELLSRCNFNKKLFRSLPRMFFFSILSRFLV